jgi:hypothetical protein
VSDSEFVNAKRVTRQHSSDAQLAFSDCSLKVFDSLAADPKKRIAAGFAEAQLPGRMVSP